MMAATLGRWSLPPGYTAATIGADIELRHPGVGTGHSRFENARATLEAPERDIVRHAWQTWRATRPVQTLDGGPR